MKLVGRDDLLRADFELGRLLWLAMVVLLVQRVEYWWWWLLCLAGESEE
jgi:hypothetical protein